MTKQDDELKEKLETITKSYACTQVFYDEASEVDYPKMLEAIEALIKEQVRLGRINQLDQLIDIESKAFNKWTQKDIANFFDTVGKQYRQLEQEGK